MGHPVEKRELDDADHGKKVFCAAEHPFFSGSGLPRMIRPKIKWLSSIPPASGFLFISGSRMRTLAKNKESPPDGFLCSGGWEVLVEDYDSSTPSDNSGVPEAVPA